jgi:hypothetical protein
VYILRVFDKQVNAINPDCPLAKNSVIPAKAGIQLIENYPAKRGNMTVLYPQGVGCGCKGLKPQQHTLSTSRNVLLLDSRFRENDKPNGFLGSTNNPIFG